MLYVIQLIGIGVLVFYRMVNSREVKATSTVMLLIILMKHKSADSSLVQVPSNTTVMVNQSTYFNCSTSIRPIGPKDVIWYHYPLDREGQRNYVYDEGRIITNYMNRFDIEKNLSTGTFNLIVMRPEPKDAGRYECVDDVQEGIGASAELTVLASNFVCESDFDPSGVVGPTHCDRAITPYEAPLSCSVTYIGKNVPQMKWSKSGDSLITLNTHCGTKDNRVTCNTTLTSELPMNGAVYICQSTTQLFNCSLEVNNVIYAFANNEIRNYFIGDEVICIANTSKQVPCSYKWKKDNTTEVFPNRTLKPPDPGLYRCHAQCLIRNDNCTFTAMVINVAEISESGKIAAAVLAPITLLILVVIIAASVAIYKKRKEAERQRELKEYEMKLKVELERQRELKEYEIKLKVDLEGDKASRQSLLRQTQPAIYGLAILKDEVFISYLHSPEIDVYDSTTFQLKRHLKVDGLTDPEHIVSCNIYCRLYSFDWSYRGKTCEILRIDPHTGKVIKNWKTFEGGGRLSVANDTHIILNINYSLQLNEYTAEGELLRRINLASGTDIVRAWHAIKFDIGQYLVCHGGYDDPKSRVCMMSIRENDRRSQKGFDAEVVKTFGDEPGSLLKCPIYLDVDKEASILDKEGSILVCDQAARRLFMLNSSLEEREQLDQAEDATTPLPWRVCVDDFHGRYLVADYNRLYACKKPRDGKIDWQIVLDKTTSTT